MQLPPTVMTKEDRDSDGHHRNLQAQNGTISALEFFRASGWPIFRLQTQLRMAKGLFDTCHREVYSDVPFLYGSQGALVNHASGVNLEKYLKGDPNYRRSGHPLEEESRPSRQHLDFLTDMVKTTRISAADIAIITPYAANVELTNRRRTSPEDEVLSAMPPKQPLTLSRAGRPTSILVVVIMGTTEEVGPGFTTDQNRLNVMFSRQKSGLLVFGDMYPIVDKMVFSQLEEGVIACCERIRHCVTACSDAELQADPRLRDEPKTAELKIGLQAQTELLQLVKSSGWSTTRLSVTKALWETFPVGPEDADPQRRFEVDRTASISRAGKLTGAENPDAFRLPGKQSRRRTQAPTPATRTPALSFTPKHSLPQLDTPTPKRPRGDEPTTPGLPTPTNAPKQSTRLSTLPVVDYSLPSPAKDNTEACESDETFEDSEDEPESDVEFDDLEEGLLDNESDAEDLPADESAP
ncbi:hypothetical protein J3E69DRAFT_380632 [Trichoderma sp. SZMC 28015]